MSHKAAKQNRALAQTFTLAEIQTIRQWAEVVGYQIAPLMFDTFKKSGTGWTAPSANQNVMTILAGGSTRFIFDSDGDSHEDGTGWTAYDDHDDIALLEKINSALVKAKDPIKAEFWQWVAENANMLQDLKLITFNADGHHFINRSKIQELLVGAVRQQAKRIERLEQKLLEA